MIFILAGTECTGKTTLAKALAKDTNSIYIHNKAPKTEVERIAMQAMYYEQICSYSGYNLVFDRSWYCEMVYGPIFRGSSAISLSAMHTLESVVSNNGGGMIIYCTSSLPEIWATLNSRGDDMVQNFSDLSKTWYGYEEVIMNTKHMLPIVKYDFRKNL